MEKVLPIITTLLLAGVCPLTDEGRREPHEAGRKLNELQIKFDDAHTSYLKRAIISENIVLSEINQLWIPQHKTWRLNERHYGALRGQNKQKVRAEVGDEQFMMWRRSFEAVPPRLEVVPICDVIMMLELMNHGLKV